MSARAAPRETGTTVKIKAVEFAGAIARPGGAAPPALPQIAFAGRSNVGKSSLINRVLDRHRKNVARVSSQPGKTQEINFYRIRTQLEPGTDDVEFYLVDLPGYGFARAPAAVRAAWRPLIESYLSGARELIGVVQLIDVRHDPTPDDVQMIAYLAELGVPTLIALTKADKLTRTGLERQVHRLTGLLGVDSEQVVPFSAQTGMGRADLLASLRALLAPDRGAETSPQTE